jgi:pimeloyl-ACP methyl ester carboxylesterase
MSTTVRIPRRRFVAGLSIFSTAAARSASGQPTRSTTSTFVLVHGAWHGGWCWKKVAPLLRAAGHDVYTPTLTGLGERAHLATPGTDLETHVADISAVFFYEDLHNVILVGHSYGGMVVGGVAPRVVTRLAGVVYLDAFMPEDGKSLADYAKFEPPQGVWRVPVPERRWGVTNPEDLAWMEARLTEHPVRALMQPARIESDIAARVPHTYIRSSESPQTAEAAERAKRRGFKIRELLSAGHDAMITRPADVAKLLAE